MADLVEEIAQAEPFEMEELLQAILDRYTEVFPNWEISTISLEKSFDRNAQIDKMINLLQNMKTPTND